MKIKEENVGGIPRPSIMRRSRTNTEETALILTSMSMGMMGSVNLSSEESSDEFGCTDYKSQNLSPINSEGYDGGRSKNASTKHISLEELRSHFDRPIIEVAKEFGICITLMKKICRRNGIKRWPHRQIRSLSKSIASMEAAMMSASGLERMKYEEQICSLKQKRDAVIADPNRDAVVKRVGMKNIGNTPATSPIGFIKDARISTGRVIRPEPLQQENVSPSVPTESKGGRWTSDEHLSFLEGIRIYGKDWRRVAQVVGTRSAVQTRTHAQKYLLKSASSSLARLTKPVKPAVYSPKMKVEASLDNGDDISTFHPKLERETHMSYENTPCPDDATAPEAPKAFAQATLAPTTSQQLGNISFTSPSILQSMEIRNSNSSILQRCGHLSERELSTDSPHSWSERFC